MIRRLIWKHFGQYLGMPPEKLAFMVVAFAVFTFALVLGGASRLNSWQVTAIEFAAIALLPLAMWQAAKQNTFSGHWLTLGLVFVAVAIPVAQLIPLPTDLWRDLPGRQLTSEIIAAAGLQPSSLPLSLQPDQTLRAGLTLSVPIALFIAAMCLDDNQRDTLVVIILIVLAVSVGLGLMQFADGPTSRLYPYPTGHRGLPLGIFANRNHQASFLLCSIPIAAALVAGSRRSEGRSLLPALLSGALVLAAIVMVGALRSRAGAALLVPTLVASMLIIWRSGAFGRPRLVTLLIGGVALLGVGLVGFLGLDAIIARFGSASASDLRFPAAPHIWQAGLEYFPFGSGLGTFESIYRTVEPIELMQEQFLNHAHNEYLELWLETGVFGIAAVLLGLIWYGTRVWRIWLGRSHTYPPLAYAGTIVVGILLAHSLLDYPLRTFSLMALFAFACALSELPPRGARRHRQRTAVFQSGEEPTGHDRPTDGSRHRPGAHRVRIRR